MLLALLACAAPETPPATWPAQECSSAVPLRWGSTTTLGERALLVMDDGVEIAVELLFPQGQDCSPVLVMVPPGFSEGLDQTDSLDAAQLGGAGFVVVSFDPRGRGESGGEDDHGGPRQQDDLAAVLRWAAALPGVDNNRMVVRSRSLGVAMMAGAVDRNADLDPAFWADLEGPGTLPEDLEHVSEWTQQNFWEVSEGEAWWADRSPVAHIGSYRGHYRRIQADLDHATGSWMGHAQSLLNAAVAGEAARVDLNGNERTRWSYEDVVLDSMTGRVKADDPRAQALVLDLAALY